MENNNQELNNIETIDLEENSSQPVTITPQPMVDNSVQPSEPVINSNLVDTPQPTPVVANNVQPMVSDIPVDDINSTIPSDESNNPQAQALKEIEPEKQEQTEIKDTKKEKNNSLLPLILLFAFLMAFILFLPKISELLTGI